MFKKLLSLLAVSSMGFSIYCSSCYCGQESDSRPYDMPFISALKEAKGKDKEYHKMSGIDFVYVIAAKKCHRFDDLKRSFAKYNVFPYRFTAFSPKDISSDTMYRTCLHGKRGWRRYTSAKLCVRGGKFMLDKRKMRSTKSGYIHRNMSIKALYRALSHLSVVKDSFYSGYEYVWIMDSGTELRCDPNVLSTYIERANKEIPDWTSLYTDYSERDSEDYLEPIGHFFGRPDVEFLEIDDYLSREEEIEDEPYNPDDEDPFEDNQTSASDIVGRRKEQSKLVCEDWDRKHNHDGDNNSGDGATGPSDQPGTTSSYGQTNRARADFIIQNKRPLAINIDNSVDSRTFSAVGLLKGAHSYVLNRKGMKLIMDYYLDHKIYIPYAQEIQIIPGMHPYCVPVPITKNTNKG